MSDQTIHLLLLEDDKVDQMAFARFVRAEKVAYDYIIAGSIAEAKKLLTSTDFDVVVADYILGDGTLFDMYALLKDIPVIVITGAGNEEIAIKAMKSGASDYLIKDPRGSYLKTLPLTVEKAVKRKAAELELENYREHLESMVKERTAKLEAEIVERKRAEETLQESEEKFRSFSEQSLVGVYLLQDGIFKYVNPKFAEMFGYTVAECLDNMPFSKLVWPEDLAMVAKQVRGRTSGEVAYSHYAFRGLKKAGDIIHAEIYGYATHFQGRAAATGTILDITDRKQADEALREMEASLQHAQKMEAIGTLAGGIAHDFNNILFPLLGYAELLRDDLPADSPLQSYVNEILQATKRSKDLVRQILAFGRQGAQDMKPIKLQPMIKEALGLLRASIPTTIAIQNNLDPDCGVVIADPIQIHQVLMNLATNAYHAMEETGGSLKVTLQPVRLASEHKTLPQLAPGAYALLTVTDTGVGIRRDVLDKVFEPYFTTKEAGRGTGLGLSVVLGIVKSCHGDIRISSEPGQGTRIQIYLPRVERKVDDILTGQSEPIQGGSETILLVDDEKPIVKMLQLVLERLGYRITSRTGSVDALEAFKANPKAYDLIVTDMTMPKMTGAQLAREIKKIRPACPVILCTGFNEQINAKKCEALGVQGYVVKPVIKSEIAAVIRTVLDGTGQDE